MDFQKENILKFCTKVPKNQYLKRTMKRTKQKRQDRVKVERKFLQERLASWGSIYLNTVKPSIATRMEYARQKDKKMSKKKRAIMEENYKQRIAKNDSRLEQVYNNMLAIQEELENIR